MSFVTLTTTLAAAVADDGTVTLSYPAGTAQADFTGDNAAANGVVILNENDVYNEGDPGIALSYGGSDITLTNQTGVAWAVGTTLRVQLGQAGADAPAFEPAAAIADLASGATAATIVVTVNTMLDAMRDKGMIAR